MSDPLNKFWSFFLQNGRCVLCGEPLDMSRDTYSYGGASWEHKVPASQGGPRRRRNLALSHRECNHMRQNDARLKVVRPPEVPMERDTGRRPLVPFPGIWHSHFRLPIGDRRWERAEQRERMAQRLAK